MVKINRTYSIDANIVEKLKQEGNNSELINNLLESYFNRANSKDLQHLKKELDILETEIDGQRRERDRKADVIRSIEDKAQEDSVLVKEENEKTEKEREIRKNIFDLIKSKELDFGNFQHFKNSPDFINAATKLFNEEISLDDYKNVESAYIEKVTAEPELLED